jgi:predicted esterase YcpF (UPF0227 family)
MRLRDRGPWDADEFRWPGTSKSSGRSRSRTLKTQSRTPIAGHSHSHLVEYTDTVLAAIGDRDDLIVVGQSLGGFTAPLVCDRVAARLLVLVATMVPAPGANPIPVVS